MSARRRLSSRSSSTSSTSRSSRGSSRRTERTQSPEPEAAAAASEHRSHRHLGHWEESKKHISSHLLDDRELSKTLEEIAARLDLEMEEIDEFFFTLCVEIDHVSTLAKENSVRATVSRAGSNTRESGAKKMFEIEAMEGFRAAQNIIRQIAVNSGHHEHLRGLIQHHSDTLFARQERAVIMAQIMKKGWMGVRWDFPKLARWRKGRRVKACKAMLPLIQVFVEWVERHIVRDDGDYSHVVDSFKLIEIDKGVTLYQLVQNARRGHFADHEDFDLRQLEIKKALETDVKARKSNSDDSPFPKSHVYRALWKSYMLYPGIAADTRDDIEKNVEQMRMSKHMRIMYREVKGLVERWKASEDYKETFINKDLHEVVAAHTRKQLEKAQEDCFAALTKADAREGDNGGGEVDTTDKEAGKPTETKDEKVAHHINAMRLLNPEAHRALVAALPRIRKAVAGDSGSKLTPALADAAAAKALRRQSDPGARLNLANAAVTEAKRRQSDPGARLNLLALDERRTPEHISPGLSTIMAGRRKRGLNKEEMRKMQLGYGNPFVKNKEGKWEIRRKSSAPKYVEYLKDPSPSFKLQFL